MVSRSSSIMPAGPVRDRQSVFGQIGEDLSQPGEPE